MVHAPDAAVKGAEVGVQEVPVDQGLEVMIAAAGAVGANDRELVGQPGQVPEGAAEGDTGQGRGDFAGDTANSLRGRHLGSEGLDVGGPAVQEKEDDRFAGGQRSGIPGGAGLDRLRERKAAQEEAAESQEFTAVEAWSGVAEGEHAGPPLRTGFLSL